MRPVRSTGRRMLPAASLRPGRGALARDEVLKVLHGNVEGLRYLGWVLPRKEGGKEPRYPHAVEVCFFGVVRGMSEGQCAHDAKSNANSQRNSSHLRLHVLRREAASLR